MSLTGVNGAHRYSPPGLLHGEPKVAVCINKGPAGVSNVGRTTRDDASVERAEHQRAKSPPPPEPSTLVQPETVSGTRPFGRCYCCAATAETLSHAIGSVMHLTSRDRFWVFLR